VTVAAGALTSLPANLAHFDAPLEALGILRTDHPHYFNGAQNNESEAEFVSRITNNLEQMILREGPDTIAAFIAEPITGASGVIVPPAGYYEKVQAILSRYDILFWADEVITGFGRTGNDFGATTMNIEKPDMMTFAKQLSSAYYPISASLIRGDMYEAMIEQSAQVGVFGHGYTYSGHPVGCAIASKVLDIYQRDQIFQSAAEAGEYMQRCLSKLGEHPLVGNVRGRGLLGAAELVANKKTGELFKDGAVGAMAVKHSQDNGLIVRAVAGNSVALCPPLITSPAQIDEIMTKLTSAFDSTLDEATRQGLMGA